MKKADIEILKKEMYRDCCAFISGELETWAELGVDDETAQYPARMLETAAKVLRALPTATTKKELVEIAQEMYWKEPMQDFREILREKKY